jgi:hypothetical protein
MDINLNITILDINREVAEPAYLRYKPMPQTDGVDDYPTLKAWIEADMANYLLKCINRGIDLINDDAGQPHLTSI